ncbi:preprotein translocase subunit SecG [Natronospira sp.]|uniref:preprotein translocase subunit SecG n=1 Tax=Natronospira sp. TaxID=2024970 RepID=UPI003872F587
MGTYVLISVLILITCILLVMIVLVQNAKGGGLASNFSSSNQVMGVRKTTDFLEKATWTLAIVLLLLTLSSTFVIPRSEIHQGVQSEILDLVPAGDTRPMDFPAPSPATIPDDVDEIGTMPVSPEIED